MAKVAVRPWARTGLCFGKSGIEETDQKEKKQSFHGKRKHTHVPSSVLQEKGETSWYSDPIGADLQSRILHLNSLGLISSIGNEDIYLSCLVMDRIRANI